MALRQTLVGKRGRAAIEIADDERCQEASSSQQVKMARRYGKQKWAPELLTGQLRPHRTTGATVGKPRFSKSEGCTQTAGQLCIQKSEPDRDGNDQAKAKDDQPSPRRDDCRSAM